MDWAQKRATDMVGQFRTMFREDAAALADGLVNVIAGELRSTHMNATKQALDAADALIKTVRQITPPFDHKRKLGP
jgi:hypothetical protein